MPNKEIVTQGMPPKDELLACFDAEKNGIEPQMRSIVHAKPLSIWHATAGVRIIDKTTGLIFCTKRSPKLDSDPGKWQSDVGGHVKAESTIERTAIEELREEAGIVAREEDLILLNEGSIEELRHHFKIFLLLVDRNDPDFKAALDKNIPNDELVAKGWFDMDDIDIFKADKKFQDAWKGRVKQPVKDKIRGILKAKKP